MASQEKVKTSERDVSRNIELKARCGDLSLARDGARSVGAVHQGVLVQTDTYFHCASGRLKLRQIDGERAELIWYARADSTEIRSSDYVLTPVPDADSALAALTAALGTRIVVKKRRELWMYENVRIHLDQVDGLGQFVEFEAVIRSDSDAVVAPTQIQKLRAAMKIFEKDLVSRSYSDLLEEEAKVRK